MECVKEKEFGKKVQETVINMREHTETIKNGGLDSLLGRVAIVIKETMKEMYVVVMDKCFGQMELFIRVSG
jgi:hypothetical protein